MVRIESEPSIGRGGTVTDSRNDTRDATAGLAESEARYRQLVESCPEPIVVHAKGRIRFVNPAALEMLGADDASQVIGRPVLDFVPPDFHALVAERIRKMLETHTPAYLLEEKIVRLDGTLRDVEIAGAAVVFQGEPAIQLVGRDITERRRAEAARARLEDRVREGRRRESVLRLAEGVANELQSLSSALKDSVDECVAERRPIAGTRLAVLRKIGGRMHDLTEQLQGFVGKRRPAATWVDLSGLVLELSERLDSEVDAANLGIDLPVGLPRIRADVVQLRRIISVLVRNSLDALGPSAGGVTVRTFASECDASALADYQPSESLAPGHYVGVEVCDTGCGMDEATRVQVLEPFFSTKSPGRGLALAEVLGLVGACGGGIRVASAPGRGTTVTVLFPVPAPELLTGPRRKEHGNDKRRSRTR